MQQKSGTNDFFWEKNSCYRSQLSSASAGAESQGIRNRSLLLCLERWGGLPAEPDFLQDSPLKRNTTRWRSSDLCFHPAGQTEPFHRQGKAVYSMKITLFGFRIKSCFLGTRLAILFGSVILFKVHFTKRHIGETTHEKIDHHSIKLYSLERFFRFHGGSR